MAIGVTQQWAQFFNDNASLASNTINGWENDPGWPMLPSSTTNFILRIKLFASNSYSGTFTLQFNRNGGAYSNIPIGTGSYVYVSPSSYFANHDAIGERLFPASFGGRRYLSGEAQDTTNTTGTIAVTNGDTVELAYSLRCGMSLSMGDKIGFRVTYTAGAINYGFTPIGMYGAAVAAGLSIGGFRFVADNANQNSGTFIAPENTWMSVLANRQMRLRFKVYASSSCPTDSLKMRVRISDASFIDLPVAGSTINASNSTYYANHDAITSERLLPTGGTWTNGEALDTLITTNNTTLTGKRSEYEWCFALTKLAANNTYDFTLAYTGGTTIAILKWPRILVYPDSSLRISNNILRISNNTLQISG